MLKLETLNELTLKVTCDGQGELHTKKGAWIGGEYYGNQAPFRFEKEMLGPGKNAVQAIGRQLMRRFTGENLELAKVKYQGQSITYFADMGKHVTVIKLGQGQVLSVESENILAFCDCDYRVRFIGVGVVSQKGLATSTLTAMGPNAQVAILTDGNPIVLSNMQNGSVLRADPDAAVCWMTQGVYDPAMKFDFNLKTLIPGQTSGETYQFEYSRPSVVVLQPSERTSGIDIGMDGQGGQPVRQDNNLFRQDGNQMFNNMNMGNNNGGFGGNNQQGGLGGLGSILGGIIS